jgi:DUF4097 and DUF4098 domain-containing protein YvlB
MSAEREQRFNTPEPVWLEVRVPSGKLNVITVDDAQTLVRLEGSERMIEATTTELVGDRLVVELRRKTFAGFFGNFEDSFRIEAHVPLHSHVKVATASADATLAGTFASLEMKSASGDLTVSGELEGNVLAKTVSGDLDLPRVGGDLDVQTVSGDVRAELVAGSVSTKSVSGDVRVASVRQGTVNFQSVSGDVALGVALGTNVDIDAASASGDLSSEVPLSEHPSDDAGPTVVVRGKTVSGDLRVFRTQEALSRAD